MPAVIGGPSHTNMLSRVKASQSRYSLLPKLQIGAAIVLVGAPGAAIPQNQGVCCNPKSIILNVNNKKKFLQILFDLKVIENSIKTF